MRSEMYNDSEASHQETGLENAMQKARFNITLTKLALFNTTLQDPCQQEQS